MYVLVVEDEPFIAMVLEEVFAEAGHEVMLAETAADGLSLVEQHPGRFSAVVTDFHTPGKMHGGNLIERIRQLYPVLPIVLATALGSAVTSEWRKRHTVELIAKPYSIYEVVSTVERMIAAG